MVTTTPDNRIDADAEKRFFIEMLVKDIELLPAIVDLVDNCVDGARNLHGDGNLENQWVKIEVTPEAFEISDNSGGISVDIARHYAFRFGRSKNFSGVKRSVGQFGVGMKRAIFKLGRYFTVDSQHRSEHAGNDSTFSLTVDVDEWAMQDEWTFHFGTVQENVQLEPDEIAGTKIRVEKLHTSVADDLQDADVLRQLKAELKIRHQESIQSGLALYLNGERLTASRPSLQSSELIQPIFKEFEIDHNSGVVEVKLFAGTIAPINKGADNPDDGQAENFQDPGDAGWYLFCNDRLLLVADRSPITGWGSPAAAYHPQYRLFRGFVYLAADDASLLPWNTTKTAVDRDSPVFRKVQNEMKLALVAVQGAINRAKNERAKIEENDEKPEMLVAFDESPDVPLSQLPKSKTMVYPAPPARPRPTAPARRTQRVQYAVEVDRFKEVAASLNATTGSEVGRLTFDYFYDAEIG
ncbi:MULTISPECIES: ATP-binding protein [Rhodococcus]|uniref:ATP-binding protein n=1 Tax=Rhodococcus TaxID=1827 RepID=UPI0029543B74|nr:MULTISPECIES: ATP-binding protein [Rhodococcus]MDV7244455.1 ATP-binding protein [Rhodococcus oxybenzonivorans]MDV7274302.1 ATP-binding protein [Rhodococcus oxybenzonivorans]MDV7337812.1 ATP-binding protein [Rhodococcus oxybenzonivorans]MDV7345252.1 ATP-binding protein [Rhodococcus oxybenzonivorans]MDV8028940.1 ATP-binding protein [Rhodococcus sp. IEGM 27]